MKGHFLMPRLPLLSWMTDSDRLFNNDLLANTKLDNTLKVIPNAIHSIMSDTIDAITDRPKPVQLLIKVPSMIRENAELFMQQITNNPQDSKMENESKNETLSKVPNYTSKENGHSVIDDGDDFNEPNVLVLGTEKQNDALERIDNAKKSKSVVLAEREHAVTKTKKPEVPKKTKRASSINRDSDSSKKPKRASSINKDSDSSKKPKRVSSIEKDSDISKTVKHVKPKRKQHAPVEETNDESPGATKSKKRVVSKKMKNVVTGNGQLATKDDSQETVEDEEDESPVTIEADSVTAKYEEPKIDEIGKKIVPDEENVYTDDGEFMVAGMKEIAKVEDELDIEEAPVYTENDEPVYTENDEPVYTENDEPVYTENDEPVYTENDEPVYTENDEVAVANEEDDDDSLYTFDKFKHTTAKLLGIYTCGCLTASEQIKLLFALNTTMDATLDTKETLSSYDIFNMVSNLSGVCKVEDIKDRKPLESKAVSSVWSLNDFQYYHDAICHCGTTEEVNDIMEFLYGNLEIMEAKGIDTFSLKDLEKCQ